MIVANVLMPFMFLGFLLIRFLLPMVFPSLTRNDFLILMLFLPGFILFLLSILEKAEVEIIKLHHDFFEILKSFLGASIAASLITFFMK